MTSEDVPGEKYTDAIVSNSTNLVPRSHPLGGQVKD